MTSSVSIFVLTEIHEAMEKRDSDPEWLERWVESRPEIFADTAPEVVLFTINRAVEAVRLAGGTVIMPGAATTAAVSALVPELCAWVTNFVTNPPNRAHPDEHTPADLLAMALIGIGDALGHNNLSSLPAEVPGRELVGLDESGDER
jgi:hypothetical protein